MNKKGYLFLAIIILIIIGIVYVNKPAPNTSITTEETPMAEVSSEQNPTVSTTTVTTDPTVTSTTISSTATSTATTHTITYTEKGFSPSEISIKVGDTVTFKNNAARSFWPASNDHPSHNIYPEFDPKKPIAAGESWSFTFTKVGSWKYHDHRSANLGGTITVK